MEDEAWKSGGDVAKVGQRHVFEERRMLLNERVPFLFVDTPIHFRVSFSEGLVDDVLNHVVCEIETRLCECGDHHALHLGALDEALVLEIVEPEGEVDLVFPVGIRVEHGERLGKLRNPFCLASKRLKTLSENRLSPLLLCLNSAS